MPDIILKDGQKQRLLLNNMAVLSERNVSIQKVDKLSKNKTLNFKLQKRGVKKQKQY